MSSVVSYYEKDKMLEDGWNEYTQEKESLCQCVMEKIPVPHGYRNQKEYWEDCVRGTVTYKWKNLKTNLQQSVRGYVFSE